MHPENFSSFKALYLRTMYEHPLSIHVKSTSDCHAAYHQSFICFSAKSDVEWVQENISCSGWISRLEMTVRFPELFWCAFDHFALVSSYLSRVKSPCGLGTYFRRNLR